MPGYMSGSARARGVSKIINKKTCGGNKKGGLAPSVGWRDATSRAIRNRGTTGPLMFATSANCPASYKNYRSVLPTVGIISRLTMGQNAAGN